MSELVHIFVRLGWSPATVFCTVITTAIPSSLQQYNGSAWVAVDGRIWTGFRWIPYSSFDIFHPVLRVPHDRRRFDVEVMVSYTTALLDAVADFLAAEPIIYLFAIICLLGILKMFRAFLP